MASKQQTRVSACRGVQRALPVEISGNLQQQPSKCLSPAGIFDGLSSLVYLRLLNNKLESLPAGIFNGLSSLTDLYLDNNKLKSLPAGVFGGLSSLQRLHLSIRNLEPLPISDGLWSLQYLCLDNNKLESLPAGIFDGLSSLRMLYLSYNKLSCISSKAFTGLSSLSQLDLTGNNLPCYHPSWPSFATKDANLEPCLNETHCDSGKDSTSIATTLIPTTTPTGPAPRTWTLHSDYLRCRLRHKWQELRMNNTIKTGGLGKLMVVDKFEVWLCSYLDSCAGPRNAFCYVYDEEEEEFIPWGLEDELMLS
uniref:Uncharacterized protein n=1 Tax=Guillardia theta TaxID=55529 RepID=A0A7S4PKR1_GUITH|mmetsp:Transcript_5581/g.19606  ORF Transcript_5581/g.19606 Transcript_5581/m.19606 type:complete len:308 (+) Transcript_5581:119-1042(+)